MADVNLGTTESLKIGLSDNVGALSKATSTTLVEYLISGETIFPSGYDIAAVAGDGITMRERSLSDNWLGLQSVNNFTYSGMVIPASSLTLSLTMPSGVAYIAGRYLAIPATVLTFSPSTTSYVFLKVTRDANLNVTGAWYEVNTTSTPPTDATPIATATTSVGAVTGTTDARLLGPGGVLQLTSGTSWTVKAGLTRIYVEVFAGSGGGGGGSEISGNGGSAGTAGGTTSFTPLSATGGGGGFGGNNGGSGADHGTGSGGQVARTGGGMVGGNGGNGGTGPGASYPGGPGGNGGYAAGYIAVTPGTAIVYAIGSAGSGGAGGSGGGAGNDGIAGDNGSAGTISIFY